MLNVLSVAAAAAAGVDVVQTDGQIKEIYDGYWDVSGNGCLGRAIATIAVIPSVHKWVCIVLETLLMTAGGGKGGSEMCVALWMICESRLGRLKKII